MILRNSPHLVLMQKTYMLKSGYEKTDGMVTMDKDTGLQEGTLEISN